MPSRLQHSIRRWVFRRQILSGRFKLSEPEYLTLESFVERGDWVVDVGANVGHYTLRMSHLVGPEGRVFAFEPIPETFDVLSANVLLLPYRNVTLLNLAVSDRSHLVGFNVPVWDNGLKNYFEAHINEKLNNLNIYAFDLNSFHFEGKVSLVKVDAEGHELKIVMGMGKLLERDHPKLIIEANAVESVGNFLSRFGYRPKRNPASSNCVFL